MEAKTALTNAAPGMLSRTSENQHAAWPGPHATGAALIGYEIAVRIAGARDVDTLHTFDSGLWCGQGAAAAAGWLRGLDASRIANAIAITTAPGQTATDQADGQQRQGRHPVRNRPRIGGGGTGPTAIPLLS